MRIIDMLEHRVPAPGRSRYQRQKIRPEFADSEARYRAFMAVPRTLNEIAAHMGYTYSGARASILRFEERDMAKRLPGRPARYIWK